MQLQLQHASSMNSLTEESKQTIHKDLATRTNTASNSVETLPRKQKALVIENPMEAYNTLDSQLSSAQIRANMKRNNDNFKTAPNSKRFALKTYSMIGPSSMVVSNTVSRKCRFTRNSKLTTQQYTNDSRESSVGSSC